VYSQRERERQTDRERGRELGECVLTDTGEVGRRQGESGGTGAVMG